MSQVSVTINGRQFRMACEDGQEGHLMNLARELDARIEGLRAKFGEIGDTRLTVMAALTIADELAEMGYAHQAAGGGTGRAARSAGRRPRSQQATQAAVAAALNRCRRAHREHHQETQSDNRGSGNSVALGLACRICRLHQTADMHAHRILDHRSPYLRRMLFGPRAPLAEPYPSVRRPVSPGKCRRPSTPCTAVRFIWALPRPPDCTAITPRQGRLVLYGRLTVRRL